MSKQNVNAAFGIRDFGFNQVNLTNDQIKSLWYLANKDLRFKLTKMQSADELNGMNDFGLAVDHTSLQWAINNAAYLCATLAPFYAAVNPQFNQAATLDELRGYLKPLKKDSVSNDRINTNSKPTENEND